MSRVFAWVRRLTALGLIIVAAVLAASGQWKVCRNELPSGSRQPVEVCNPPAATDLGPLLIAAIALMLLWQDVAEIGLPGGISVKRRLEQQEKKVDQQETRQGRLEERLSQIQQQVQQQNATAIAAPQTSVSVVLQSDRVLASTEQKEQAFLEAGAVAPAPAAEPPATEPGIEPDGAGGPPEAVPEAIADTGEPVGGRTLEAAVLSEPLLASPQVDPERAQAELELVRLWARLESLTQQVDSGATATLSTAEGDSLARWRRVFEPELAYVQSVRNSIAHGIAVSDTDIDNTLEVARRLLSIPEAEVGSARADAPEGNT